MSASLQLNQFEGRPTGTTLVFGGDFCPIRRYERKILDDEEIFSADLKSLFQDHVSIVNLEAPICEETLPTASPSGYGLRSSPDIVDYLRRLNVDLWGLANNHIRDYEDEGVRRTIRELRDAGLACAGAGETLAEAEQPVELNADGLRIGVWTLAEKELNLASSTRPGSAWFDPLRNVRVIEEMRNSHDFLVIFVHAGHEFTSVPSPRIRDAYRAFIDAGADAVVGHHPHVIQGVERYQDGLIAYSLGNLIFDSPYVARYENTDLGYLLKLDVSEHRVNQVEVIPYKLRGDITTTTLNAEEFSAFKTRFLELSNILKDDVRWMAEWEENVRFRWKTEYSAILENFSTNYRERLDKDFPRRSRNLFTCPTHIEMMDHGFRLMEKKAMPQLNFQR